VAKESAEIGLVVNVHLEPRISPHDYSGAGLLCFEAMLCETIGPKM
jgi:hypothetical protein